jgi:UDP-N-acetyl-D-glucosamine dehydrogenase
VHLDKLEEKIKNKDILLGVIGLGYVGLPLCLTFLKKGIKVIGFDSDPTKIDKLEKGLSYIKHISPEEFENYRTTKQFIPTCDFSMLNEPDGVLICVPTPLTKNREPDMQYIEATAHTIAQSLRPGQIIVLESTTYPGSTVEVLQPILEEKGLTVGKDFALAYSPEREDPGNANYSTATIPKVVGGVDALSTKIAAGLYGLAIEQVIPVSCSQAAEMTKLLENIFRSVNIALVNELKMLCHRMGINIYEVIDAASTKPFGYMPFYPGPGLGGHCIPIDPFYLTSKAREYDFPTKFIELAGEVNTSMPYYVLQRVMESLNTNGKSLKDSEILILGAAYKKDVDDSRESPFFKIMDLLIKNGAQVSYNDPHIPQLYPVRKYSFTQSSIPLNEDSLSRADCVLIITDHSVYDYQFILDHAKLIVDTRNVFAGMTVPKNKVLMA